MMAWRVPLLYLALAVALTWPLVLVLGTHVPHDLGDPILSTWTLWWNSQRIPFTAAWWDAPQFYPIHGSIAFSDHRVGLSLISEPVQRLGGSPLLAANLALLLSFPLSATAAHWLVFVLTRRHDAALVAGLAFGFNPYRIAHIEHLELVSSYWMPVALLALHQYVKRPTGGWLALFSVAWLLQSLSSTYYLFFFSVLVALWLLWFTSSAGARKPAAVLLVAWVSSGVLLLPVLLKYRSIHQTLGLERSFREVESFSADVTAVLSASPLLAFWRSSALFDRPEGQLFFGAFVIALVVAGLAIASMREKVPRSRWGPPLLGLAAVFGLAALTPLWWGPWRLAPGGFGISVSSPRKPLSLALACVALYCILHPRVRRAYQRQSAFAFYVIAALVLWVLSWGPVPKLLGYPMLYQAPYSWLMRLPGFESGLRVPARFAMPAMLALSVAGGLAFARVVPTPRRTIQTLFFLLIVAGIVADGWIKPLPLPSAPAVWSAPLLQDRFSAVLELPLARDSMQDAAAVYRSIYHRHPIVNGFSGHYPSHYAPLQLGLEVGDQSVLTALANWGPILIAIDRVNDPMGGWTNYVSSHKATAPVGSSGTWSFFLLPAAAEDRANGFDGVGLGIQRVTSNFTAADARYLTDRDLHTRWVTSGPQRGTEEVVVDLGAPKQLSGCAISLGRYTLDFPRTLAIDTSPDGVQWATVWQGPTVGLTVAAALRDPNRTSLRFKFSGTARFVRLRETRPDPVYYWSIAELEVLGSP